LNVKAASDKFERFKSDVRDVDTIADFERVVDCDQMLEGDALDICKVILLAQIRSLVTTEFGPLFANTKDSITFCNGQVAPKVKFHMS
jgi:hypothetical protein